MENSAHSFTEGANYEPQENKLLGFNYISPMHEQAARAFFEPNMAINSQGKVAFQYDSHVFDVLTKNGVLDALCVPVLRPLEEGKPKIFAEELRKLINKYSLDAESNTKDGILANYLIDCFCAYTKAILLKQNKPFASGGNTGTTKPEKGVEFVFLSREQNQKRCRGFND